MIQGKLFGTGLAQTPQGVLVPYRIVQPEKDLETLQVLGREGWRWRTTAERFRQLVSEGRLPQEVAQRATFADEVGALAGEQVRTGVCCWVAAEGEDGRLLGVMSYNIQGREGTINLLAIDPEHLVDSPGVQQLRGIGTGLVAALSRDFLAHQVQTVYLHPLDSAAERFWRGRGFTDCGLGARLCLRGRELIEGLKGTCEIRPDAPDRGEVIFCGAREATVAVRVP